MKNKKAKAPKKTIKRPQRLFRAKPWLAAYADTTFTDKQIVHAHAKKFHTGYPCAILELRLLEIPISTAYEENLKKALAVLNEQRRANKEARLNAHLQHIEQDEHFAFIAGYTGGGVPYGIQWHELDEEERALYTYKHVP